MREDRKILALDADGVVLDYNHQACAMWEKAFGETPIPRAHPTGHHFPQRFHAERLQITAEYQHFQKVFRIYHKEDFLKWHLFLHIRFLLILL